MIKVIKKYTPIKIKNLIRNVIQKDSSEKKPLFCPVCNSSVSKFERIPDITFESLDKYQFIHNIFAVETLNILNYTCPICGASDRDRLYALYLKNIFNTLNHSFKYKFIDFAPSVALSSLIKAKPYLEYRSADLLMENVDDNIDLTDLNIYNDLSIDFFLCSHILEHILDDIKALKELNRILKIGGRGILMVPIFLNLNEIYENPEIISEEERWKHFGQNDHVRVYSKQGFIDRVKSVGFNITELDHNFFGDETFIRCGINLRSILYIVSK